MKRRKQRRQIDTHHAAYGPYGDLQNEDYAEGVILAGIVNKRKGKQIEKLCIGRGLTVTKVCDEYCLIDWNGEQRQIEQWFVYNVWGLNLDGSKAVSRISD